jgi:uncharacterized protein YbjT (DUF2867 family)
MTVRSIVFGATGMVGEGVLHVALRHPGLESVLVIGRRSCGMKHPKLRELIHADFYDYSTIEKELVGYNACFFCLGVSSIGMKEEDYHRVTYDLTMQAATTLARLNPAMTFCYVSGAGTDSTEHGRLMWARVKGKTENHLMQLPFKAAYLFRPGFIKPLPGQKNAYTISKILGVAFPLLKLALPNQVCTMDDLGTAMIQASKGGDAKPIVENMDIARLARSAARA